MVRVKICGLMNQRDVNLCIKAGVHMTGFVVDYPIDVPWNLDVDKACELIRNTPPFVSTCVVTGGSPEKVLETVGKTHPDVVQLHYEETLEEIEKIAYELRMKGIKTIKALRIDAYGNCRFEIPDPAMAARELARTGISAILADSFTPSMPGGTGVAVHLSVFQAIKQESSLPVILAGGLNPANIFETVQKTRPYAVDVLTGVETKPGSKDPLKIDSLMNIIGNAHLD